MARSTGPILTAGAVTWANGVLLQSRPPTGDDRWLFTARVAVATGVAAGTLALIERASAELAVGVAWLALVTVLLVRVRPGMRTPLETALGWAGRS